MNDEKSFCFIVNHFFLNCATLPKKEKILTEIDSTKVIDYQNDYSLKVNKDWYTYFEFHHLLAYSPEVFKNEIKKEIINVYLVLFKDKVKGNNIDDALKEFIKKMNNPYKDFKYKVIEAAHKKYGKYYIVKYGVKQGDKELTAISTILFHNKINYGFYYLAKNEFFDTYIKDAIQMINSFEIKEPN